jgi:diaminopropionate ammonia-lyase
MTVSDAALAEATALLSECCGPGTTPSGAAGVAGAMTVAASPDVSRDIALDAGSRVLLVVTETELDKDEP